MKINEDHIRGFLAGWYGAWFVAALAMRPVINHNNELRKTVQISNKINKSFLKHADNHAIDKVNEEVAFDIIMFNEGL